MALVLMRRTSRCVTGWLGMSFPGTQWCNTETTGRRSLMMARFDHVGKNDVTRAGTLKQPANQWTNRVFGRSHVTTTPPSINVDQSGKSCTVTWDDGFTSLFHSVWLRHNCHCAQCRHDNGQLILNPASIWHDIRLVSARLSGENVTLTWDGPHEQGHQGEITLEYLRQNNYNEDTLSSIRQAVKLDTAVKEIPSISYEAIRDSKEERYRWLRQINEAGLSVVKGVPLQLGMVQTVAEFIGPVWESIYGKVFDVMAVPDPINVAYSTVHLDHHMDLVYFESPPGLQMLHCLKFDEGVTGGRSTFLDVYTHAEEFRVQHPEHFHTLTTVPATFQKIHYDRELPVHLVNQKPHIKLNHYGDIVAVYWAPAFEGPLSVSGKDVERYYAAYEAFAKGMVESPHHLTYKMVPGDLVVFNNIRILHGRTSFDAHNGERHLQGAYLNIDVFKSQVQVMSKLIGDGALPKRVGNQCWR